MGDGSRVSHSVPSLHPWIVHSPPCNGVVNESGHGVFLPLQKEAAAPLSHLSKAVVASHYCLQCKAVISFSTVIKEVKEVGGKCEAHIPAAPLPPFILPQLQQGHPERGCRRCGSKDGEKEEDRCKIKALG